MSTLFSLAEQKRSRSFVEKHGIKGILFDLDGTLIDTYETILQSMQYATTRVLRTEIAPEKLMKKVGQPLVVQIAEFCDSEKQCEEVIEVYRAYNATIHDDLTRGFPGCTEALHNLKEAGLLLGVVTSKRHVSAEEGLNLFGLNTLMSCLVGSDDCEKHKPHPEPVQRGMDLLGIESHQCVYVGDSPYDIQAGNAAGAKTIAALWGMFSAEELFEQSPDFHCASISSCSEFLLACG